MSTSKAAYQEMRNREWDYEAAEEAADNREAQPGLDSGRDYMKALAGLQQDELTAAAWNRVLEAWPDQGAAFHWVALQWDFWQSCFALSRNERLRCTLPRHPAGTEHLDISMVGWLR